jgi:hypothetical protein
MVLLQFPLGVELCCKSLSTGRIIRWLVKLMREDMEMRQHGEKSHSKCKSLSSCSASRRADPEPGRRLERLLMVPIHCQAATTSVGTRAESTIAESLSVYLQVKRSSSCPSLTGSSRGANSLALRPRLSPSRAMANVCPLWSILRVMQTLPRC